MKHCDIPFLLLLALLVAIPQNLACEDCVCGSQCFQTENLPLIQAYEDVKKVIKGIRVGNFLASPEPDSTIIHFDGTHNSFDGFLYQKKLAAIAALQVPVDPGCNPGLVITYFHWGSLAWLPNFSTGCMDKCHTATYINEFIPNIPTPAIPFNPLFTSCLLASTVANLYSTCSINTVLGSHHIAFMNDDVQSAPTPCFFSNARTAVKMAPLATPEPKFESSPTNSIEAFMTPARLEAADKILRCIESECCQDRSDRASLIESQGTLLIQKNNEHKAQHVDLEKSSKGTAMPMKSIIKSVVLREELNFIREEHPQMVKPTLGLWKKGKELKLADEEVNYNN